MAPLWLCAALLLLACIGRVSLRCIPLPPALFEAPSSEIEFLDTHGEPLRAIRPTGTSFRRAVSYAEIPARLAEATVAVEDQRFWQHPGVDWRGSLRAAASWLRQGRIVSGGSTITQQLIKLAQPRPRTMRTKIIEALQALRLEQVWTKQHILAEYLNRLDYGNLNSGCAAASEFYFGKPLEELDAAECALLAGLPQAPSRLNPCKHPDRAQRRQQHVLTCMLRRGFLDQKEFDRAREELRRWQPARAFQAPHFVDLLLNEPRFWPENATMDQIRSKPGWSQKVRTTLDLELNRTVQSCLSEQLGQIQSRHVKNAAAVVIENRSGAVRALVGSENYFSAAAGQVNGAWAPRSAGSTLKPFTYALAFEHGATPASIAPDVPAEFATPTGLFSPVNYDRHCRGPVRYRVALANSLNISAVQVLASIGGPARLMTRLQACGLTTLTQDPEFYGLGLTIGNAEVRLLELANAYALLARLGEFKRLRLVEQIGDDLVVLPSRPERVLDPGAAYLVADILSDNAARASAFGAESPLRFRFPVACKTGTSSDFRDNWALGYAPEFTVGVWVGNFDGSPMQGISGVTGAAPLMHAIMDHLHERFGSSWFTPPPDLVTCPIDPLTGHRVIPRTAIPHAPVLEKFLLGHEPVEASPQDYDAHGRVRLGLEYADWLKSGDNWLAGKAVLENSLSSIRINFPLPGTRFFLDPDLPASGRRIRLELAGALQAEWRSPTLRCEEDGARTVAWLEPGRHQLMARDRASGQVQETWIEVVER